MTSPEVSIVGPLIVTQLFLMSVFALVWWLRQPIAHEEYELWHSASLQRLYYERLKKQFNRLRAQVPKLDSIVESDVDYKAIVELAVNKRTAANLVVGEYYLASDQPLHQWVVCNIDKLPSDLLHDIYHATRTLDKEFVNNIVYNI